MKIEERIKKDIKLFEENRKEVDDTQILEMAERYYQDAKFYLEKRDFFTAFGCINYAHGLIDAVRMKENKK
ncbi:MAG: DUF357 domain-containing protein [Thermoplasmata archaeon]|nr:DUF357 domain-containing protein [Thermoplasmata archaeon]